MILSMPCVNSDVDSDHDGDSDVIFVYLSDSASTQGYFFVASVFYFFLINKNTQINKKKRTMTLLLGNFFLTFGTIFDFLLTPFSLFHNMETLKT